MAPFSYESRREIGERDNWTCECGNSFHDGWMVEASHDDHDKENPLYDDKGTGTIKCRRCHLIEHIELFLEDESGWSYNSLRLLATTCYNKGLHTYRYYEQDPTMIIDDRDEVCNTLREAGLPPETFII